MALATSPSALFDVNGLDIPTYDLNKLYTYGNGDQQNYYQGQFSSSLLRPGGNAIFFGISAVEDDSCVIGGDVVTMSSPSFGSRVIFDVFRNGTAFTGTTNVDFTLMDINPARAQNLANLEQALRDFRAGLVENAGRVAARDAEIAEKLDMLDKLEKELDELANGSFDDITSDALEEILARYPDLPPEVTHALAQVIDDLHRQTHELRAEVERVMDAFGAKADEMIDSVQDGLRERYDPDHPGNYTPTIYGHEIPDVAAPDVGSDSTFDGSDDPYDRYANKIVTELEETIEDGKVMDRAEFVAIVRGWRANQQAMERIIRERATINLAESQAFVKAQNKVLNLVSRHMDPNDWFKDAPVSPELKRLVDGVIKARFANLALSLKDGLNGWTTKGKREQSIEDLTIGMGAVLEHDYDSQPAEVKSVVTRVLGWANTAAQIGLGFTPVGDVLDACEAITGLEGCNPAGEQLTTFQRVLAGVGTVVGSRKFWEVVGTAVVSAKAAASHLAGIAGSVARRDLPSPGSLGIGGEWSLYLEGDYGIWGMVEPDGFFNYYIAKGPNTPGGRQMFQELFALFDKKVLKGVRGNWTGGGKLADNFDSYKKALARGLPPELAAFETFTGKMAKEQGFTKAVVKKDVDNLVIVEFIP